MTGRGLWGARMAMRAAGAASGPPQPVPPSEYQIHLPKDQYLHAGAPTEWWWHVGTLKAGDRIFGFEINAAGYPAFTPVAKYAFTQVMLTDVSNVEALPANDAVPAATRRLIDLGESDPTKDWYARLGKPSDQSYVAMDAPQADPTRNMAVRARLVDGTTQVDFDLMLSQQGPPLLVFGTGVEVNHDKSGPPIQVNNYYYSLTRLDASGTIKIGADSFPVTGTTWMDHEYGYFGSTGDPVYLDPAERAARQWLALHEFRAPRQGRSSATRTRTPSNVTVQGPDGAMYYFDADTQQAFMTPTANLEEQRDGHPILRGVSGRDSPLAGEAHRQEPDRWPGVSATTSAAGFTKASLPRQEASSVSRSRAPPGTSRSWTER